MCHLWQSDLQIQTPEFRRVQYTQQLAQGRKRGTNWAIAYDKTQNLILVTDKATGAFLFKVTFTPYNSLCENTILMVCFDDAQAYDKFNSYGQLITALYSKHIIKVLNKKQPKPLRHKSE